LHQVQRDIQMLVRTFPSQRLRIFRRSDRPTAVDDYGQPSYTETTVYWGEVLFSDASGTVTRYGLGQVEEEKPILLIPGKRDVRPGDFFRRDDVLYQIQHAPAYWPGFTSGTVVKYEQGRSVDAEDAP
jgi:hypothetical protein